MILHTETHTHTHIYDAFKQRQKLEPYPLDFPVQQIATPGVLRSATLGHRSGTKAKWVDKVK